MYQNRLEIAAHRGASRMAPDNTLKSFEWALTSGADYVEFDVRMTKDGILVVYHDQEYRPLKTQLADLDYADILKYGPANPDLHVPTLAEVCEVLLGKIGLVVEIKLPGYEEGTLRHFYRDYDTQIIFQSENPSVLKSVKSLRPDAHLALGVGTYLSGINYLKRWHFNPGPIIRELSISTLLCSGWMAKLGFLDRLERDGILGSLPLWLWTVNSTYNIEKALSDPRIAGIITDVPHFASLMRDTRAAGDVTPIRSLWGERFI